jgi:Peptidase family S41
MKKYILFLAILLIAAGCGSSSSEFGKKDSLWLCRLQSPDVGYVEFPMRLHIEESTIEGESRPGVAGRYIGFFKLLLAKMFSSYFENGALMHIRNGRITGDSVSAILSSALGALRLKGTLDHDTLRANLTRGGRASGSFIAIKMVSIPDPLRNYRAITDSAITITDRSLFDSALLTEVPWQDFEKDFHSAATTSEDDVEFLFAFFYIKHLPFSHYYVFQEPNAQDTLPTAPVQPGKPAFEISEIQPNTLRLNIRSFSGSSYEIDSVFDIIFQRNPQNLIIDLRENPGGNLSAMELASYLTDSAYYGGVFVTNLWFHNHTLPPSISDYAGLPTVTNANANSLLDNIHKYPAVAIKLTPNTRRFHGRVIVLTSNNTASACEPLVSALQLHRLATIVGEQTAGAMLNAEKFDLGNRWFAFIPTADYYTADGVRLEGVGVTPDVKVPQVSALDSVLSLLTRW